MRSRHHRKRMPDGRRCDGRRKGPRRWHQRHGVLASAILEDSRAKEFKTSFRDLDGPSGIPRSVLQTHLHGPATARPVGKPLGRSFAIVAHATHVHRDVRAASNRCVLWYTDRVDDVANLRGGVVATGKQQVNKAARGLFIRDDSLMKRCECHGPNHDNALDTVESQSAGYNSRSDCLGLPLASVCYQSGLHPR